MKINLNNFEKLIKEGYISRKWHESAPYQILNYTPKCQFDQFWNEQTKLARGLILDKEGNVIARPFEKFFNWEEYGERGHLGKLPNYNYFDVFDKLDGSLGILYKMPDNSHRIATRGSFESEQAKVATNMWAFKYEAFKPDDKYTYLFEIIYPENRIVVDYGNKKDLTLLAVIDKETGKSLNYAELLKIREQIGCPMTHYSGRHAYKRNMIRSVSGGIPEGAEGFVLLFDNGLRVKIKSDEYKRLHKILTGVSTKTIWELLRNGQDIKEYLYNVPDEFYDWAVEQERKIKKEFSIIHIYCKVFMSNFPTYTEAIENEMPTKDLALRIKQEKYASVLFAMWREKPEEDIRNIIWKMIKPVYEQPFKQEI